MNNINYYLLEKVSNKKSTFQIVKYFSLSDYETESFKPLKRNLYLDSNIDKIQARGERKPIKRLSSFGHISGIYIPNLENLNYGFGDLKGTKDLIQFLFYPDIKNPEGFEMFIRAGEKSLYNLYNNLYFDGGCDDDFCFCRNNADDFSVMNKPMPANIILLDSNKPIRNNSKQIEKGG